jgi:hypothetical protein
MEKPSATGGPDQDYCSVGNVVQEDDPTDAPTGFRHRSPLRSKSALQRADRR